jgi:protein-tyrosine-phosphatase
LELENHRSTPVTPELVEWADLILAMSPAHLQRVRDLGGEGKGDVLTAFTGTDLRGVPDPFGGNPAIYEETLHLLEELVEATLRRLEPILAP